jgi:class 3 adenylate cyclase
MTSLQAYLPLDRRISVSAGAALPDRVQGAALFADISGFTALTAALYAELGARQGAEALIAQLNRVFTDLVAVVHEYGGAAINFGGDSITCWFDGGDARQAVATATERAVACAAQLQQTMQALQAITTPGGTAITLGLKVAVAAGPARRFLVGDPAAYVLEVLAGATLDRMAAGEELARRGEVVVTAAALNLLPTPPPVLEWRHDVHGAFAVVSSRLRPSAAAPWPPAGELADSVARPWLLPPVYEHLRYGPETFLAELRTATMLFVRFSGLDYDGDDDAGAKLDGYICRVQETLTRYEGFLLQITMGDKGGYLHASFGAPVAHEDDAARAAAAALEIARLTESVAFLARPQIGISTGLVHSGAYGSPERRTYGVIGNEVNVAARLMTAAAPGQILVSASMADQIAPDFDVRRLPPVQLKGMGEATAVWSLEGRRGAGDLASTGQQPSQPIGRTAEQAAMDSLLADLAAGQSGVLIIEGEAGIGKSLLAADLVRRAAERPAGGDAAPRILAGYGDAVEQSTPYYAWRPIAEQLFGLPEHDRSRPLDEWRERAVATLAPDLRHLAPLLNAVLPLELPETPLTEQITGEARQDNILGLLVSVMGPLAAAQPLIVILDDAHWLDSVSWTLARRVQRDVTPLLLVVVARPMSDAGPAAYQSLRGLPAAQTLSLTALSRPAIEELVARRLGVESLPPSMARLIHEKAEGHPFFSEELAYALRDSGLVAISDGTARLTVSPAALEALDFPNSIEGVITSRIDALPPSQQLTVKVASVIGRIFAFRTLREIHPVPGEPNVLRQDMDELERLDITPQETPEPDLAYVFKQILTQEVVYDLMTTAQKRRLHHDTAVYYEQSAVADAGRLVPLIAYHYQMAGDRRQASVYYGQAGENAFRDFANKEAMRFLELALSLGDDASTLQQARWHTLLAEAAYRLTLMADSVAHYQAALALLGHKLPDSMAVRGVGIMGQMARQLAHRWVPGRFVARATGQERETLLEAARAYEGLAEVLYNEGDALTSFYSVLSTLNLSERAGPSPELLRSYANMAPTAAIASQGIANAYRVRAVALESDNQDLVARAAAQVPLSVHSVWIGDWDQAEAEIAIALDIYGRLGEWRRWGVAAWLLPQVVEQRGQLTRARDLWAELYNVALRSEDDRHQVRSQGGRFFNFLSLNQPAAALAVADELDDLMAQNPEMVIVEERMWYAVRATRALLQGETAEARNLIHEQMAAIGRARLKYDVPDVFSSAAENMLTLWEQGAASSDEAKQASRIITSFGRSYPSGRARANRLNGRYAWLSGKPQQAEKLWADGLSRAEALGMDYERALLLMERGRALGRAEEQAEAEALLAAFRAEPNPPA